MLGPKFFAHDCRLESRLSFTQNSDFLFDRRSDQFFLCRCQIQLRNPVLTNSSHTVLNGVYSTATSLDLQNWTAPQMILNSRFPVTTPCIAIGGQQFDGWHPSFMLPGAAAGHTKLTGHAFFMNGCNLGTRQFMSRTFTIVAAPRPIDIAGGRRFESPRDYSRIVGKPEVILRPHTT